jgi:inositol-phosphate phosphatase/L-galactose 1-phosphate phosphatase/histidinol-phosphatase
MAAPTIEEPLVAELCSFAEELAEAAREQILPFWRKPLEVEDKDEPGRPEPESPVTIADRNAEKAMRALIEARYPQHGIFGEELGSVRLDSEFVWVLDPIDGTKSFITGKPLFGTLIGLCHRGVPTIGVIDQCVLRERWVGVRNVATKLNGAPVRARGKQRLADAILYATTPHMFADGVEADRFAALRALVKRPLYGCDCYAYALVASGFGADLVVEVCALTLTPEPSPHPDPQSSAECGAEVRASTHAHATAATLQRHPPNSPKSNAQQTLLAQHRSPPSSLSTAHSHLSQQPTLTPHRQPTTLPRPTSGCTTMRRSCRCCSEPAAV